MRLPTESARPSPIAAALVGGIVFGAIVAFVNGVRALGPLAEVIGVGWSWAAIGVLAGAVVRWRPILTGTATLLCAVLGYYLADAARGVYLRLDEGHPAYLTDPANAPRYTDWGAVLWDVGLWGAIALILGPLLALVGTWCRRPGLLGLGARLVVPVGAATEMFALRLPSALTPPQSSASAVVTMAVVGLAAAVVGLVMVLRHGRRLLR